MILLQAESTTVILNGHAFNNLAEADAVMIQQPNARTSRTNSERGVTIAARNDSGVTDLTLKVERFSEDDVVLSGWQNGNSITVINGSVKESFNRDDSDFTENWKLEAGSITSQPEHTKNNQEPVSVIEYVIQFRNGVRII